MLLIKKKIMKKMKRVRIGALNCQGIENKFELPEFINQVGESDLFGVSEIWLAEDEKKVISVKGFRFYPLSRKKRKTDQEGV